MTSSITPRPPVRTAAQGALTSSQIDDLVGRIRRQMPGRERQDAREEAIRALIPLARRIAGRYRPFGAEDQDDLLQVACVGLVKAIDGYDPAQGHAFLSYAVPTIAGEVKRHLRDRASLVRLPRTVQEARLYVARARRDIEQSHGGHSPAPGEIALACGLAESAVAEALRSQEVLQPRYLDACRDGPDGALPSYAEVVGDRDPAIESAAVRVDILQALLQFPERERHILLLRLFHDQTQQQIATTVGISQMHVSRLLTRCLARLREVLGHLAPSAPAERQPSFGPTPAPDRRTAASGTDARPAVDPVAACPARHRRRRHPLGSATVLGR